MVSGVADGGSKGHESPCQQLDVQKYQRQFEYDSVKSASNKEKHGIDFDEAKVLWGDDRAVSSKSKHSSEIREILIAKYDDKHYTAIYTVRNGKIRIISVRRSRSNEVNNYEKGNYND